MSSRQKFAIKSSIDYPGFYRGHKPSIMLCNASDTGQEAGVQWILPWFF